MHPQRDVDLGAGECGTEAEVHAEAERHDRGRTPGEVEAVGIGEDRGIAVGGHDAEEHRRAGWDLDAVPDHVARVDARDPRGRRVEADALLTGMPALPLGVGAHERHLIGMRQQRVQRAPEAEVGGVRAGGEQQLAGS